MPKLYRPTDRIFIDWADDDYEHPFADVSYDIENYSIQYGSDLLSNSEEITFSESEGSVRLANINTRYSTQPSDNSGDITNDQLFIPHNCRILSLDENPIGGPWKGTAIQVSSSNIDVKKPTAGWTNPIRRSVSNPIFTASVTVGDSQYARGYAAPSTVIAGFGSIAPNTFTSNGITFTVYGIYQSKVDHTVTMIIGPVTDENFTSFIGDWGVRVGNTDFIITQRPSEHTSYPSDTVAMAWHASPGVIPASGNVTLEISNTVASTPINSDFRWSNGGFRFGAEPDADPDDLPEGWAMKVKNITTGALIYYPGITIANGGGWGYDPNREPYNWIYRRGVKNWAPVAGDELEISMIPYYFVLWEGIAIPNVSQSTSGRAFADFKLASKNYQKYKEKIYIFSQEQQNFEAFVNANLPSEIEKVDNFFDDISTNSIGVALFENNVRQFCHVLGQFSHGWAYEDRLGRLGIISWEKSLVNPSVRTLSMNDFRFISKPNRSPVYKWLGLIKNKAVFHALPFERSDIKQLGTIAVNPVRGRTQEIEFRYTGSAFYISDWQTPAVTNGNPADLTITETEGGKANRSHTITVTFAESIPAAGNYWITFSGREHTIGDFINKSYENAVSIEDYGERVYTPPNWYPTDGSEFKRAVDFISRLALPMDFVTLTLPRWTVSDTILKVVNKIEPGEKYNVSLIDINNNIHTYEILVLGVSISKRGKNTPVKNIQGISISDYVADQPRWGVSVLDVDVFLE